MNLNRRLARSQAECLLLAHADIGQGRLVILRLQFTISRFESSLANDELARFKALVAERLAVQPKGEGTEYNIYPPAFTEPYVARRFRNGEDLYRALGIAREDRPKRLKQFARNFEFFGAPVGLIFAIDRQMGSAQWADLGMYMQSIMLLAVERGLGACSQEAWALWHETIREFLGLPDQLMLFCGMALGYPEIDHPVNSLRTERADPSEYISMRGFGTAT